jgi:hypothetical protein
MLKTQTDAHWNNPRCITLLLRDNKVKAITWAYTSPKTGLEERAHILRSGGRLELYIAFNKKGDLIDETQTNVGPIPIGDILGHTLETVQNRFAIENIPSQHDMYLDPRSITNYHNN